MQYINRDQTRIEWCQFECFGLKILITRGLVVIIGDFKSENSILTNLAPINWSIFWIKIITSHYTFFVVHQKLRNNKLEDGFVMNWHTIFGIYRVWTILCVNRDATVIKKQPARRYKKDTNLFTHFLDLSFNDSRI